MLGNQFFGSSLGLRASRGRRTGKAVRLGVLLLFSIASAPGTTSSAFAQSQNPCSRKPSGDFTKLQEADAKAALAQFWQYHACSYRHAKNGTKYHKFPGHDELADNLTETFNLNAKRITDRKRFPINAYMKKAFGQYFEPNTYLDILNYFKAAQTFVFLQKHPSYKNKDPFQHMPGGFAHRGGDVKANTERVARELRLKPVPPWFVIGDVEFINSEIDRKLFEARRRYLDAQHAVEFQRVDLKHAENQLTQASRDNVEFESQERQRVVDEAQRLTQKKGGPVVGPDGNADGDFELVLRDHERRKQVARDRLARFQAPFDKVAKAVVEAERTRDAAMEDIKKIQPLTAINLRAIESPSFAAEPQSEKAHDYEVKAAKEAIEEATKEKKALAKDLGERIDIRNRAFDELKIAYEKLNNSAESAMWRGLASAVAQTGIVTGHQYIEIFKGSQGPISALLRGGTQIVNNLIDPPKIVDPYGFDWTAINKGNLKQAQIEIESGMGTKLAKEIEQERSKDADWNPAKQAARHQADKKAIEHIKEAGKARKMSGELARLEKRVQSYATDNGFKKVAKHLSAEMMKDFALGLAVDTAKAASAKFIEGPAVQAYIEAYAAAGAYANLYSEAVNEVEMLRDEIDAKDEEIQNLFSNSVYDSNRRIKITKNEPFFAEADYGFELKFSTWSHNIANKADWKVTLTPAGGNDATTAKPQAGIALKPVVTDRITYRMTADIADKISKHDVEKLRLTILVSLPR